MTMHTPPANQGQIVEVSYGATPRGAFRRVYDRSDRSEQWYRADWDAWEDAGDSFEPWNASPEEPRGGWQACSAPSDEEE